MTDYIIIDHSLLPYIVIQAFISFSLLGIMIWREIEYHKE